jgi:hypothetical protein
MLFKKHQKIMLKNINYSSLMLLHKAVLLVLGIPLSNICDETLETTLRVIQGLWSYSQTLGLAKKLSKDKTFHTLLREHQLTEHKQGILKG